MNDLTLIREACIRLGMSEPISIEPDGTVWLGANDDRQYPDMAPINEMTITLINERVAARQSAAEKLRGLGLTDSEIAALGIR